MPAFFLACRRLAGPLPPALNDTNQYNAALTLPNFWSPQSSMKSGEIYAPITFSGHDANRNPIYSLLPPSTASANHQERRIMHDARLARRTFSKKLRGGIECKSTRKENFPAMLSGKDPDRIWKGKGTCICSCPLVSSLR